MRARNSNRGYGWVFWSLHWTSATLFLLVAIVATSIDGAPDATQRAAFVARHASLGQALLVVMLARVIWRFINPNPVWSYPVGRPRRLLAVLVHWLIHATVLIESLTGLALIGAGAGLAPVRRPRRGSAQRVAESHLPSASGAYPRGGPASGERTAGAAIGYTRTKRLSAAAPAPTHADDSGHRRGA